VMNYKRGAGPGVQRVRSAANKLQSFIYFSASPAFVAIFHQK